MKPTLLILAAGMGSRYGGLKQMDPIGPNGETIIDYSIHDAIQAGFGKIVFVIRESFEEEFKLIFNQKLQDKVELAYVNQEIDRIPSGSKYLSSREKPWGTGHAILVAKELINEPFAVINADDYYGKEAFVTIAEFLKNKISDKRNCMVGYQLQNTISVNGSVSRGICNCDNDGNLTDVTERTQIEKIGDNIAYKTDDTWTTMQKDTIVSMNFWGFTPSIFDHLEKQFIDFLQKQGNELKSEFFIPTVVSNTINNKEAKYLVLKSNAKWFGVTYIEDKAKAINAIDKLIETGEYPAKLWD